MTKQKSLVWRAFALLLVLVFFLGLLPAPAARADAEGAAEEESSEASPIIEDLQETEELQEAEEEAVQLRQDGGGSEISPLALGDVGRGTTGGGASYFKVGYGDGTWKELLLLDHSVILDGTEYVAYCVMASLVGPNEPVTEANTNFSDRVLTGLQAILDHGYPTVDGGQHWERYCTAFAINMWMAQNGAAQSDSTFSRWTNFQGYSADQRAYIDQLLDYADQGVVSSNGLKATYFVPNSNRQTLVVNLKGDSQLELTKVSAIPEMTAGNSCYSLEGAVYGVYRDEACTELVAEIVTDANGYGKAEELTPGLYYIREITPSKGFLLDSSVYPADLTSGDMTLTMKEPPANDPVSITITKITDDPATTLPSLEGTQFTVKFYAGQYASVEELPEVTRTWVIATKSATRNGKTICRATLNNEFKVSGDEFFGVDAGGNAVLPLGTVTIQETQPAEGYTTIGGYVTQAGTAIADADGIILLNITEDASSTSGGALSYGNEYTKTDKPIYGGVMLQKFDAETKEATPQGAGSFSGAAIRIVSLHENDVTVGGQVYAPGQTVYRGQTDENGLFQTAAELLPAGRYKAVEDAAPKGYLLSGKLEAEFEIAEDGVIVSLDTAETGIADRPIRADFSLLKQDGDTKEPMANVLFSITSNTTGESHTFSTGPDGYFNSRGSSLHFGAPGEGGALLYDTYTIEELACDANKGFTLAEPITLTVDGSSTLIQVLGVYNYQTRMKTAARFLPSGGQWSLASGTVRARDTVSYDNLLVGVRYTLVTKLWNKSAGEFLKDETGDEIAVENTFIPRSRAGVQTLDLRFNADNLAGADVVVYEYLYADGRTEPVLVHADPEDVEQTLHFPKIETVAVDAETGLHFSLMADEISITDSVWYKNLIPGKEYRVKGVMMDAATGQSARDAMGREITSEAVFTPDAKDGKVDVTFTFSGKFETAKQLVAFEEIYQEDVLVAVHADLEDEGQTVYLPKIRTSARDAATGKNVALPKEDLTICDTVKYEGLKPGVEFTIKGKVVQYTDLESDPEVLAEAETVFTPSAENGEAAISFSVNAEELAGERLVVIEEIYLDGALIAEHKDPRDEEQAIYVPAIGTTASDDETEKSVILMAEKITVVDLIRYKGLKPGAEYTVKGTLMDTATGKPAMDAQGREITAEAVFTPNFDSGAIAVAFTFNGNFETGKKFVAFEEIYQEDVLVAVHAELEDEGQTVFLPKIHTSALSPVTGSHMGAAGEMLLTDTVYYEGAKPGEEYVIYGRVVDADAPETVLGGAMAVVTPDAESGSWELTFNVNAKDYNGKTLVVLEQLMLDGTVVAIHTDTEDVEQQIVIPEISTTARDSELGGHTSIADDDVTVIDTLRYKNFIPGLEYNISAKAVLKDDPDQVLATVEQSFTPDEQSGELEISLSFNGSELAGETVVICETITYNDILIAVHEDLNDSEQAVVFPGILTVATVGGEKVVQARDRITLLDEIAYVNFTDGETYTVCGVLMDKATGQPARDAGGKEIRAEAMFIAKGDAGTVWLNFEFNGEGMSGKTLVVFDTIYLKADTAAQPIATHEDINSEEQSIYISSTAPKTGDESNPGLWFALFGLSGTILVSVAVVLIRRKKAHS